MTSKTLEGFLSKSNSKKMLRVKFRDIAENIVDRVDVPSESGYERFVGGTHLDPETMKIMRWGSTSDVHAQKLLFKKGHILFGKRRSYLRKAAYADFDGVCSAHMLVLKSKPELMLENYFVFFIQSNQFWKTADKISEGSMSPTIKWKILAKQEFSIPPKEEQSRIANFLWTIEKSIEQIDNVIGKTQTLKNAIMKKLTTQGIEHTRFKQTELGKIPETWKIKTIGEVSSLYKHPLDTIDSSIYIGIENIESNTGRISFFEKQTDYATKQIFKDNTILFGRIRPYLNKKWLADQDGYCSTDIIVLDPHLIQGNLLLYHLLSPKFVNYSIRYSFGSQMPRIHWKDIQKYKIPYPPLVEQRDIVEVISKTDETLILFGKHKEVLAMMKKRLLNDLIN